MISNQGGIRIDNLRKVYGHGDTAVEALKNVNMQVAPGEVVGLVGPSGSGKSTLLKCLGAIIEPTSGRMTLGQDIIYDNGWQTSDLRALRRDRIGFVFQAPYLIPFLDVTDNVALLPMLAGVPNAQARARALELLGALDVAHRAQAEPAQLSGGEQQRVSIARAITHKPKILFADEPTANLDSFSSRIVMDIFKKLNIEVNFVQDNQSLSQKGTIRGLHYQTEPFEQGKLVRVVQGRVLDVALDIRKDSATYGQYFALELNDENQLQFYIPPGFACLYNKLPPMFHICYLKNF